MFMRDVESDSLYTQMKGRGVRTIGDEQLRNVTPNAHSKDLFFLVDAVGVTEHEHYVTTSGVGSNAETLLSLRQLLERISHGELLDEHLRLLASRLSRIHNKANEEQRNEFIRLAGTDMRDMAPRIYEALDNNLLPEYVNINEPNNERKGLVRPLAIHPDAREYLCILNA